MYIYIIMKRTQIYLDETTYRYLKRESLIRKKTMSELIREAIKEKMLNKKRKILSNLEDIIGIWKDKDIEPESFLQKVREDRQI